MEHEIMNTMLPNQQLEAIVTTLFAKQGSSDFHFYEPVQVKTSPHTHSILIHSAAISPMKQLWIRTDEDGLWRELKPTDKNYEVIISSLYQRLSILLKNQLAA